jgi:hypothetical protein
MIAGILLGLWLLSIPICTIVNLLRGAKLARCLWIIFFEVLFFGPILGAICYFSWR